MSGTLPSGRIASVQVGRAREMTTAQGKVWRSAIVKESVTGPVPVKTENLDGDEQANRKYHGGPDKVVCLYPAANYPFWRDDLQLDMPHGAFGENLTLDGLTEDDLCIGDRLQVGGGDVVLEVSQPRIPCINVSRRWNAPRLPKRMEETGRTGFYCRVVQTGTLQAGDSVIVTERPNPGWTIRRANFLLYPDAPSAADVSALRDLPALSGEWKRALGRKLKILSEGQDA